MAKSIEVPHRLFTMSPDKPAASKAAQIGVSADDYLDKVVRGVTQGSCKRN